MTRVIKKGERKHIAQTLLPRINQNYRELVRLHNILAEKPIEVGGNAVGLSAVDQKRVIRQMVKEINKIIDHGKDLKMYLRIIARREDVKIDE